MCRVLLISPLPRLDPAGGDVTYTETLLAHPPEGVRYITYADALADGTLREHGVRKSVRAARKGRSGFLAQLSLAASMHGLNRVRRKGWLFREPFRFFSVEPAHYDLIHLHVFSARFFGNVCPIVVSNAIALRLLYTDGRHYSHRRVRMMETAEHHLGKLFNVNVNSYRLPQAARIIAFTEVLKKWYVQRNIIAADKVDVIPIYLPRAASSSLTRRPRRVGFIGAEFEAKGGLAVLAAFQRVRAVIPYAELIIVGSKPRLSEQEAAQQGVIWMPFLPRQKLLDEIIPSFDVFAYPTAFDGLPLVLLEAMSRGVAIAASDYQAIPEILDDGKAGLISKVGDTESLARNILQLLDPETNARYRKAAEDRFNSYYAAEVVRPRLRACYDAAIAQHAPAFA